MKDLRHNSIYMSGFHYRTHFPGIENTRLIGVPPGVLRTRFSKNKHLRP